MYAKRQEQNQASARMMAKCGFAVVAVFHDPEIRPHGSRRTAVCRLAGVQGGLN